MGTQQIYLPIGGLYLIPYEFEADTMQVPRGKFSILSELARGNITSAEAMIYLCLNHGSTWNSGATWCMSGTYLSNILGTGMSKRHALRTLSSLTEKGWIKNLTTDNPTGYRYRVRHHLCHPDEVPVDKNGKPLKFAVPRGPGGPLERCFEGDISWKAALVWIVLKRRSNWIARSDTAGQTGSQTLQSLAKRCRIKLATVHNIITELTQAGMLHRLTPKSQKAIFQLYPKPVPKAFETAPPPSESTPPPRKPVEVSESTPPPMKSVEVQETFDSKKRAKKVDELRNNIVESVDVSQPPPASAPRQSKRPNSPAPKSDGEGRYTDTHYYSRNMEYRCCRKTGLIERRTENAMEACF